MRLSNVLSNGLIKENPVLFQLIGMCPTLAVTTSVVNGIGMGIAVVFVLTSSNFLISLLRKVIPETVRIPCFIIIIASFVTIIDLSMRAYTPDLSKSLGLFIPLIVVNCIILARAEAFASKNSLIPSLVDGVGMGLGFTLALTSLGAIRELLGTGMLFAGFQQYIGYDITLKLIPADYVSLVMILPPGAFITLGLMIAVVRKIREA